MEDTWFRHSVVTDLNAMKQAYLSMHVGVELAARHIVDEMRADGHRGVCDFGIECVHRDQHIPKRHVARQRPVMHKGERPTVRIQGSVLYDIVSTRQQLAMAMCVLEHDDNARHLRRDLSGSKYRQRIYGQLFHSAASAGDQQIRSTHPRTR